VPFGPKHYNADHMVVHFIGGMTYNITERLSTGVMVDYRLDNNQLLPSLFLKLQNPLQKNPYNKAFPFLQIPD
jgi:hypothetical protein